MSTSKNIEREAIKIKQILIKLHSHILQNYSNVAYQKISGDTYFNHIPVMLHKLWYSGSGISLRTLAIRYDSDIDYMPLSEMTKRFAMECQLYTLLRIEFAKLKNRK